MLKLISNGLNRVIAPLNGYLGIHVFTIYKKVKYNERKCEHGKFKLVMNPVILRLVLKESN